MSAKAVEYDAGFVIPVPNHGYIVRSRTVDGGWWLVSGNTCSCPAGQHGTTVCFHRTQVARFAREMSERNKRPRAVDTGNAVTSRFVD